MAVDLAEEIRAYEEALPRLRAERKRWVVFLEGSLQGDFDTFSQAVEFAMAKFPREDFLIRDTRAEKVELPFLLVVA